MSVATGDEQEEEIVDLASDSIEDEEDSEEIITAAPAKVLLVLLREGCCRIYEN